MNPDLKKTVAWFLHNLDLLLEDLSLEKNGITIDMYFDTVNVRDALLGMDAFGNPRNQIRNFYLENTLVNCLAASGWFGIIQMLPPHQSEFLNLLHLGFGIQKSRRAPKEIADKFLASVKVSHAIKRGIPPLHNLSQEELRAFVRKHAVSAENFFKAVQCIRGGSWQARLGQWKEKKLLNFAAESFDYAAIIKSEDFKILKKVFDEKRRDRPVNNFADAVAIKILISHLQNFISKKKSRIPRFFASSDLFIDAIEEAGIMPLLTYTVDDKKFCILREADYFIFRATFRSPPLISLEAVKPNTTFMESKDLLQLREQVATILSAQAPLTPELINEITVSDKPLGDLIEELQQYSFLENVWLKFSAEADVQNALLELSEATRQLKNKRLQREVEEAVKATKKALETNAQEYRWVSLVWNQLQEEAKVLRYKVGKDAWRTMDFFRDFGLMRFAFPQRAHQEIRDILEAMLSGEEEAERDALTKVIAAGQAGRESPAREFRNLAVAAAIFWVANMRERILDLFDRIDPPPHFSLSIIYASTIFKLKRQVDQGYKILRQLEQEYKKTKNFRKRADLAVGLAYLYFHLARCRGFEAPWRQNPEEEGLQPLRGFSEIKKAIEFAREAFYLLPERNIKKKIYALNQYVYYMVESGDDAVMEELRKKSEELSNMGLNREVWQYRFDDTLARYFHRLAVSSSDLNKKRELILVAKRHIEEAWKKAYGDGDVKRYKSHLELLSFSSD